MRKTFIILFSIILGEVMTQEMNKELSVLGERIYINQLSSFPNLNAEIENVKLNQHNKDEQEKNNLFNLTMNNITYTINTTANNTECIPECYVNCQVHFPDPTEQNYCLINVCHCEIIEMKENRLIMINMNYLVENLTDTTTKDNEDYVFRASAEQQNYYILLALLFLILIPPMIYFLIEMYNHWKFSKEIGYEYPFTIPDYMLIGDSA